MTMTTPTQDRARTAQDLLADADADFAAGDMALGSLNMWKAARCAVETAARTRGWASETPADLLIAVRRLAEDADDPMALRAAFGVAGKFEANARIEFMESQEDFEDCAKITRGFVRRVLALAGER